MSPLIASFVVSYVGCLVVAPTRRNTEGKRNCW